MLQTNYLFLGLPLGLGFAKANLSLKNILAVIASVNKTKKGVRVIFPFHEGKIGTK